MYYIISPCKREQDAAGERERAPVAGLVGWLVGGWAWVGVAALSLSLPRVNCVLSSTTYNFSRSTRASVSWARERRVERSRGAWRARKS